MSFHEQANIAPPTSPNLGAVRGFYSSGAARGHPLASRALDRNIGMDEAIVFKKPARKANMRKRKAESGPAEGGETADGPGCASPFPTPLSAGHLFSPSQHVCCHRSMSLELVKELQRQRQRSKGVTLELKGTEGVAAEEAEGEEGRDLSLATTFTAQTDAGEVDPNMLKYIEEQMEKEEGSGGAGRDSAFGADEELFATPAHLQQLHSGASAGTGEVEDAGRWLAGIVEVQVKPEDKIAAIEATELAKRKLMEARAGRSGRTQPAMEIPSNFNADFHNHRKESQALVKSKQGRGAGPHDPNLASDGRAAAQFRKHERNKR